MTDPNPAGYPPGPVQGSAAESSSPLYANRPAPNPAYPPTPNSVHQPQAYPYPPAQGYAIPPQGYAYPPQGYANAPQGYAYPPQGYALPAPSGRLYWALLFMLYIPYVGLLVALIVALVQRSSARKSPHPIMRENARWAANWALSYFFYFTASLVLLITIGISTSRDGEPSGLIAIPAIVFMGIGIYALVTMIIGTVRADRVVHRPVLAIPFFGA